MQKLISRALVPLFAAAAVVTAAPVASASEFVPCNDSNTRVCYRETGPTNVRLDVRAVNDGQTIPLANIAAYLDIYEIPFGTGGVQVPCVTPVVNGAPVDSCGRLGLTLLERRPLVHEVPVGATVPGLGDVIASVYVCEAELTVLVSNVGVRDFPLLSACQEKLPQFST